jgi:hypothetical protein
MSVTYINRVSFLSNVGYNSPLILLGGCHSTQTRNFQINKKYLLVPYKNTFIFQHNLFFHSLHTDITLRMLVGQYIFDTSCHFVFLAYVGNHLYFTECLLSESSILYISPLLLFGECRLAFYVFIHLATLSS